MQISDVPAALGTPPAAPARQARRTIPSRAATRSAPRDGACACPVPAASRAADLAPPGVTPETTQHAALVRRAVCVRLCEGGAPRRDLLRGRARGRGGVRAEREGHAVARAARAFRGAPREPRFGFGKRAESEQALGRVRESGRCGRGDEAAWARVVHRRDGRWFCCGDHVKVNSQNVSTLLMSGHRITCSASQSRVQKWCKASQLQGPGFIQLRAQSSKPAGITLT